MRGGAGCCFLEGREGWERGRGSHRAEDLANPREQEKRREHGAWIHEKACIANNI
jgi:hypothetical protein